MDAKKEIAPEITTNTTVPTIPEAKPTSDVGYLCLTREPKEGKNKIMIGDIEISIVEVHGSRVRVGIRAPKNYPIKRKEGIPSH